MQVWLIQQKSTGLYMGMNSFTGWTKRGRVFSSMAYLKNHLRAHLFEWRAKEVSTDVYGHVPFSDVQIVQYELGAYGTQKVIPLEDLVRELSK